ncbi:glycosyltransferase family 2 protein [Spirosoma oryzicola]|uniref:glycosyltransferase family 2 protein n=1 Tax=Spirosoma oryzicola TaxID=2898794 RepID=UPI001E584FB9|nr:glycosyltransferase family A protein [Spirosoma oryzicola]UHG94585.1 glycosyltransferase family 2 protein [Spirosoma oryzicola]
MFNRFFAPKKTYSDNKNGLVTVILTVWKRHHLEEQIEAIINQTEQPYQVWVYQCGDHVNINKIKKKFNNIQYINSSVDLKYFGRFSLALHVKSEYVWILDDDVIPSTNWLEDCRKMCENRNSIISSAGRIISYQKNEDGLQITDLRRFLVGDGCTEKHYNFNENDTEADFGCNNWLFKTEWIYLFWKIKPYTLENAEDIHLSATCKILANIPTIIPAQSEFTSCGNLKKYYGHDEVASWKKINFQKARIEAINYLINEHGWEILQKNIQPSKQ